MARVLSCPQFTVQWTSVKVAFLDLSEGNSFGVKIFHKDGWNKHWIIVLMQHFKSSAGMAHPGLPRAENFYKSPFSGRIWTHIKYEVSVVCGQCGNPHTKTSKSQLRPFRLLATIHQPTLQTHRHITHKIRKELQFYIQRRFKVPQTPRQVT